MSSSILLYEYFVDFFDVYIIFNLPRLLQSSRIDFNGLKLLTDQFLIPSFRVRITWQLTETSGSLLCLLIRQ